MAESEKQWSKMPMVKKVFVIGVLLLAAYMFYYTTFSMETPAAATTNSATANKTEASVKPASEEQKLELLSYNCGRQYGFFQIRGQVKNISDEPMDSVMAVGSTYTKDSTFVRSDSALIEYNPILPGQASPFAIMGTDNPAIDKCQVEFKEFFGGTIPTKLPAKNKRRYALLIVACRD
jgi:hypothetical protein